jgi:hypothetical protein
LKFQWQAQHNNISQVEYEFELRELPNSGAAPQSAFLYSPIIHQERLFYTSLIYSAIFPPLDAGKTYGWRVRAIAKDGVDELNIFENNGYSEIFWFHTNSGCEPPAVNANVHDYQLDLTWNAIENISEYEVQFCNKYEGTGEWRKYLTDRTNYTFYSLQLGSTYQYRVGAKCANGNFVYGTVYELTMPEVDTSRMANCGIIEDIDLSNREPLPELKIGDVFMASDYPVTVTKVTGSNGVFTGEGWVMLRWILNVRVAVEFENIPINTDKRATGGIINFKYNKDWKNVGNLDKPSDGNDNGLGIKIADTVINFVIPGVDSFELNCNDITADCEIIIHGGNGEIATIILPRDSTGQLDLPYVIKDADGNTFIVDKDSTGQDGDVSVTAASYAGVKEYPCFIGYALDRNENDLYFCNTQNVDKQDELLSALKLKIEEQPAVGNINNANMNCEIQVKSNGVYMSWYKAENSNSLTRTKPTTMKFEVKLNEQIVNEDGQSVTIMDNMLIDGDNVCELFMNEQGKITLIAKYTLRKYTDETYRMEVERTISPPDKRIDLYDDNFTVGTEDDVHFNTNENIRLSVKKINRTNKDTILYSNERTQWYVNDVKTYAGAYYNYTVQSGNNPVIKAVTETNTIRIILNVKQPPNIDGNISPDYSGLTVQADKDSAHVYYDNALPRCMTQDVGTFIRNSPKPIVVRIEKHAAVGGTILQGEADDGAKITVDYYNKLYLKDITKDGDNAVMEARLISKLHSGDIIGITKSVEDGRPTQKTEILISRIRRLSPSNADNLVKMIKEKRTDQDLLNSLEYEITEGDDIDEWVTFHNSSPISLMINLSNLGNDAVANTPRSDFTRLMAHELLHHHWTHFKKFEKLKWKIIRDKQNAYQYILSDGLASGNTQDSNQACSTGAGHERHNPEHSKVCNEQYNY